VIARALAAAFLVLAACQAQQEQAAAGAPSVPAAEASAASPRPAPAPTQDPFEVRADRDRANLIAGCPHQNPATRPAGSNCYGIFPEQCGADRAAAWQSQPLTASLRARIEEIAPPGGVRFIRPGEAVIQDLRPGRLNIELDTKDRIARADCY